MSLSWIAQENLAIYKAGGYSAPSGNYVSLVAPLNAACQGTVLYTPDALSELLAHRSPLAASSSVIEVTGETTGSALRRLIEAEQRSGVVALNFASARNVGGGFLGGAKAQEEDLCRATALYPCLLTQPVYYEANRAQRSALYTDHILYSPEVPFIRDERRQLLERTFTASFITAPAPNAGAVLRNEPEELLRLLPTLTRRIRYVLAVAADHGHRTVVLGAWGCGAFRNDPVVVAPILWDAVKDPLFAGAFDRVVFAIYDTSREQNIRKAFEQAANR